MKNIAIIPARGGSKRIPEKNIKFFNDKPIISYSIETARKTGLFDEIMVSTDSEQIMKISEQYGAHVPFLRSQKNSDDKATLADVLIEVADEYARKDRLFDLICCILPTAPLITDDLIKKAYHKLLDGSYDSVIPVVPFSYPIWRALKYDLEDLNMIWPENLNTRSQDLPPTYHDSGSFYWVRTEALKNELTLLTSKCSAIVIPELQAQDIDHESDWKLCELKYKMLHGG